MITKCRVLVAAPRWSGWICPLQRQAGKQMMAYFRDNAIYRNDVNGKRPDDLLYAGRRNRLHHGVGVI